jgi:type IV pilus assembly protein PilE
MNKKGFSLIEIMIVVVIVGILAAIAIPAYTGYVTRTRRADAITALETVALYEEKNFAQSNQYDTLANLIANQGLTNPNADVNRDYNIVVTLTTVNGVSTFVATATPINAQANDIVNIGHGYHLLVFAINSAGEKGVSIGTTNYLSPNLWTTLRIEAVSQIF